MKMILNTDGGARGNPGPGAIGIILKKQDGEIVKEVGKYIGTATNNEAEYQALIEGLEAALEKKTTQLECVLDSEFVVKQLKGEYKIKDPRMKRLWRKAKEIEQKFESVSYKHVTRDKNSKADALVNEVLDSLPEDILNKANDNQKGQVPLV